MADLKLPPNTTLDPNTGLYIIRNPQGQTIRVGAQTQAELDQYANSVQTGTPISVTTTNPNTGNPQTSNFDPNAIIQQRQGIESQAALLTATKRQTGLLGNTDGSYYDIRTGQTLTQQEAAAKIQAAGLPPEALAAITPKNAPTYAAAQAAVNNTTNVPSNRTGDNAEQPSQAPAATGTDIPPTNETATPVVESSAPSQVTPETPAPAPAAAEVVEAVPVTPSFITGVSPGIVNDRIQQRIAEEATPVTPSLITGVSEGIVNDRIQQRIAEEAQLTPAPVPVPSELADATAGTDPAVPTTAADIKAAEMGIAMRVAAENARIQATLQQRYGQSTNSGDWRVRLRLAQNAKYLYAAAAQDEILWPLKQSDGVIFPYVPTVTTNYQASYDRRELTHSNYRGLFYKNSFVNDIQITGTFTAQDTPEAQYLLAVIHFFRSVTKMFYGQDEQRGAPPPLVFLSGFGQYQFNNHPCVVSSFNYNMPNGVDYIRIDPNNQGQNLVVNRNQISSSPSSTIESALRRVTSLINVATGTAVQPGAQGGPLDLGAVGQTVSGTGQTTYVPTKCEIQITLLPVQTRKQISQEFSLKEFANGNLLKRGFW
jgi:hypothetical protein